jgi:hypothetical protein
LSGSAIKHAKYAEKTSYSDNMASGPVLAFQHWANPRRSINRANTAAQPAKTKGNPANDTIPKSRKQKMMYFSNIEAIFQIR